MRSVRAKAILCKKTRESSARRVSFSRVFSRLASLSRGNSQIFRNSRTQHKVVLVLWACYASTMKLGDRFDTLEQAKMAVQMYCDTIGELGVAVLIVESSSRLLRCLNLLCALSSTPYPP